MLFRSGPQIELCSVCGQPGADGSVRGKIMVSRLVVGAHYGLRDWIAQRATAVVMAGYSLWLGVWVLVDPPQNYGAWKTMIGTGWMRIATLLFIVSMLIHAWVGVRDIVMDYVKAAWLRLCLYVLVILTLVAYAGWSVQILLRT